MRLDGGGVYFEHAQDAIGWARSDALNKLTWIVICKGGLVADVTVGDCVELTAALLDRSVAGTLERLRIATATLRQKQDLAAVIHLCGAGPGDAYARRGFRLTPGQRCGDHDVSGYLAEVNALKRHFVRLAEGNSSR